MRSRLRTLFVPTDAGDAIAELIAEHSHALETRAEELRTAVADLEQREARARELHARIEEVLREGSAELDIRHSDIVVRAAELDRREATVAQAEAKAEDRARSLGAVELKAAALERREQAIREREEAIARREQDVEQRTEALASRITEVEAAEQPESRDEPETSHVVLTIDNGYRLSERDGAAPAPGDAVDLDGNEHRCVRITTSPYPDDRRRCAVLERVSPQED
jgi:uncharacterized protein (DUF3084 family)